ncbi:MAG: hypothetical protein JXO22_05015 [Phycisphaerae bacterium]|nr:hypothetical protein [Phycisphaerae bacterium]
MHRVTTLSDERPRFRGVCGLRETVRAEARGSSWLGMLGRGLVVCAALLSFAGCPTGSDNTIDDAPPTELTAEQVQLVDSALAQFAATNHTLISLRGLIAGIKTIETGAAASTDTCPTVSVSTDSDTTDVLLDFSDAGCVDSRAGDATRAGVIRYSTTPATRNGDVTFESFQVAGDAITGTANLSWLDRTADQVTLSGTLDFTDASGNAYGIVTLTLRDTGLLTYTNGFWQFSTLATDLELKQPGDGSGNVIIDPTDNPNLLPYTGIVAFDTSGGGRIEIIFDTATPTTRTVTVRIDEAYEFPYQIR